MPELSTMPEITIRQWTLLHWGRIWANVDPTKHSDKVEHFVRRDSMRFPQVFDARVARALSTFLGGLPLKRPAETDLLPPVADCVELGDCRIIGGIRPQNYDVCYRPDGVRFAFDSKTLNNADSVRKNWQNMVNDLATEATTLHTRFPYAIAAFMVIIPESILASAQRKALTRTLERMSLRESPLDSAHRAESISLVLWDPASGDVDPDWPPTSSCLRLAAFSTHVESAYVDRYKGLPPHD